LVLDLIASSQKSLEAKDTVIPISQTEKWSLREATSLGEVFLNRGVDRGLEATRELPTQNKEYPGDRESLGC
jgi:hypothetical protein